MRRTGLAPALRLGGALLLSLLLAVLLSQFLGPRTASAQEEGSPEFEAELMEAIRLRESGDDVAGLEAFGRLYERTRSPRVAAQMGLAEGALQRWVDAETHLAAAVAAEDHPWIRSRIESLRRALEAVREHLGHLEIEASVEGAAVWVDGFPRGPIPESGVIRVALGSHNIEVRAGGFRPYRSTIEIEEFGSPHVRAVLDPAPEGEALAAPGMVEVQVLGLADDIFWGTLIAGSGLVVLGALLGGVALAVHSDAANILYTPSRSPSEVERDRDEGFQIAEALGITTDIFISTGVATAILSGFLYLLRSHGELRPVEPRSDGFDALSFNLGAPRGGQGVMLSLEARR